MGILWVAGSFEMTLALSQKNVALPGLYDKTWVGKTKMTLAKSRTTLADRDRTPLTTPHPNPRPGAQWLLGYWITRPTHAAKKHTKPSTGTGYPEVL